MPSSPWVLDYAENSCRLIRQFGQGSDQTKLALESEAPGALDMVLIGKPLGALNDEVPAKFLPVPSKPMKGMVGRSTDKYLPMLLFSTVELLSADAAAAEERKQAERKAHPEVRPPAETLAEQAAKKAQRQEFAANTTAIQVDARRNRPVILDTGSLGEPIKAFDLCSRDSLRDWGVDPDLDDKIVRGVWAPNPRGWFSSEDYPRDMLMRGQESVVKVRLLIDATGRPTKCTSLSHFEEPEFNRITCDKFMARAHFEPAELADGTKVPSYFVIKVNFRMAR
jgi:TonB family protein